MLCRFLGLPERFFPLRSSYFLQALFSNTPHFFFVNFERLKSHIRPSDRKVTIFLYILIGLEYKNL